MQDNVTSRELYKIDCEATDSPWKRLSYVNITLTKFWYKIKFASRRRCWSDSLSMKWFFMDKPTSRQPACDRPLNVTAQHWCLLNGFRTVACVQRQGNTDEMTYDHVDKQMMSSFVDYCPFMALYGALSQLQPAHTDATCCLSKQWTWQMRISKIVLIRLPVSACLSCTNLGCCARMTQFRMVIPVKQRQHRSWSKLLNNKTMKIDNICIHFVTTANVKLFVTFVTSCFKNEPISMICH